MSDKQFDIVWEKIMRYVAAEVSYSWIGGSDPEDIPFTRAKRIQSRSDLMQHLKNLETNEEI